MGILILKSSDHLGYVIKKNPASGMIKRFARNCEMSGFYKKISSVDAVDNINPSQYMIFGRDITECSFGNKYDDGDKYLNPLNYSSATFIISAISEFFDAPLKKAESCDIICDHKLIISCLTISNKNFESIEKLSKYFNIELTLNSSSGEMTFVSNSTLHYLLNVVFVLLTIVAILENETLDAPNTFVEKLCNCITRCSAPYFVRYFVVSRIFTISDFNKFSHMLEKLDGHSIKLCFGTTLIQQKNMIERLIHFDRPILDIGCGEGNYLIPFCKKLTIFRNNYIHHDGHRYYGFDTDQKKLRKLKMIINNIKNATVFDNFDEVMFECSASDKLIDVFVSEVIEHMEFVDVSKFIKKIIDGIKFNQIIVVTPNRDFNVNYLMDKEFRHNGHKWEINKQEFQALVSSIIKNSGRQLAVSYFDVGDIVDGKACTSGCCITRSYADMFKA